MLSIKSSAQALPQIVLLSQSDKAPYSGALLPMDMLRSFQVDHMNSLLYKTELSKHEGEVPLYAAPDGGKTVLIGVGCLLLGFVIGATAH